MTNQEILDNASEGATHYSGKDECYWMIYDRQAFCFQTTGRWLELSSDAENLRSLDDIRRIVELESELTAARKETAEEFSRCIDMDDVAKAARNYGVSYD